MRPYQARLNKTTLSLAFTLSMALPSFAQEVHQFSIQQSVDYALKNSAQVKNKLLDMQIQFQSNREITSAAFPQLNGNVSGTYYFKVPVQAFPNFIAQGTYGVLVAEGVRKGNGDPIQAPADFGLIAAAFGTKYNASYGATLSQLLFDGQVFVGLQARAASIEYARQNTAVTEEQIKANVYKICYQLVVGKKQVALIGENIARTEKLLHDTRELFKNGFREKLDVDQVAVSLSNLTTVKTQAENQLNTGYLGLKYLMGMPVHDSLALTDSLTEADLKSNLLNDSIRYEDRKEYQLLLSLQKLGQYNIKRYKMSYLPTVSFSAAYSRNAQRNSFNFFDGNKPWYTTSYLGLTINVPIFDGFAKDARIKQARLNLQKAQNSISDLRNNIDDEVRTAQISMHTALSTLDEQHTNMALAEQVYDQTKKKYEQGLASNIDVLSTESSLTTAQNNYFSAMYDAIVAKINYLKAVGKL